MKTAARPAPLFFSSNPREVFVPQPRLLYCKHPHVSLSYRGIHLPGWAPGTPTAHHGPASPPLTPSIPKPTPHTHVHMGLCFVHARAAARGRRCNLLTFSSNCCSGLRAADIVSPIDSSSWHFGEHDQDTGRHTLDAAGGSEVAKVSTFCT